MNIPLACSDVKAPFSTPSPSLSTPLSEQKALKSSFQNEDSQSFNNHKREQEF